MSDISTFAKWKDWLTLALLGIVASLLGTIATSNRDRITKIESELTQYREVRQQGFERLRAVEQSVAGGQISREEARAMEQRLQRDIDRLEREVNDLRRNRSGKYEKTAKEQ